jgi:hypothetical protein
VVSVRATRILLDLAHAGADPAGLPGRLVRTCRTALPVAGVGLALATDDGPAGTVACTDGPAEAMEDLQFAVGEGPCVESSLTGRPVLVPDLPRTGPARWPAFSAGAAAAEVLAVVALPLRIGGIRLGVLGLYGDRVGALSPAQFGAALDVADAATTLLLHLHALAGAERPPLAAVGVTGDRAVVHQATGMVAVQAGVSLAVSLALLRARAFATGRELAEVAHDVLSGRTAFDRVVVGG